MTHATKAIEALKQSGLTKQEAMMYVTLLAGGPLTGYEAAKRAGISRSNAYTALAGLAEKGGAMRAGKDAVRFTATPRRIFLRQLKARCESIIETLEQSLPDRVDADEPYLTITGLDNATARIRSMLESATSHVYVSAHSREAALAAQALAACASRGVKTVLISDADPGVPGIIFHEKAKDPGHVNIIADTGEVLTGCLRPEASAQCLYSCNSHLVRLMREAFLNELTLIERHGDSSS
ncbi:TrmB family transcriptional regulator [Desulfocurvus sp. DL9XJH121]